MSESTVASTATAAAPSTYAVIRTGGKQYTVTPGESLLIEKLEGDIGSEVSFTDVLLVKKADNVAVGSPTVAGASVKAKIVALEKGTKLITYKKRRRKGYTKKIGHRQQLTRIVIESVA
jgi:large subunit ribosomal protein L21